LRTIDGDPREGRIRRDLRLLWRMGLMVVGYWTVGESLRREYRRKAARGEVLWLDEAGPTRPREDAGGRA